MSRRKNPHRDEPNPAAPKENPAATTKRSPSEVTISVGEWSDQTKVVSRSFPGPATADALLRVAIDREAYAAVILHAKESLDAEICGVLVGDFCEDDRGPFVHVKAAIRGAAARQAGTHVTYTQETWNAIHKELDEKYPKLAIVGWYHSHPGFGVEFSDMDLFVQKNFFSGPAQIGLVTDPLGGEEAICFNARDGVRNLDRFWVEGRERRCRAPSRGESSSGVPAADGGRDEAIERLETRIAHLVQAIDQQQTSFHRVVLFLVMFVCLGVLYWIGSTIWRTLDATAASLEPPRVRSFIPVPIRVGDETVQIGVGIVDWKVPPEVNAVYVELEERRREAEAAARAAEEEKKKAEEGEASQPERPKDS